VLSFFLVALGVAYPLGALAQGPVANHIGVGWTTVGGAVALAVIGGLVAWRSPGFVRAVIASEPADSDPAGPDTMGSDTVGSDTVGSDTVVSDTVGSPDGGLLTPCPGVAR
jgi:hypothetical protein